MKGDVAGSVEAILDVFNTYGSDDKCQLSIVHYGVGPVTETDLQMADAFDGKNICHLISSSVIFCKSQHHKIFIAIIYPFNVVVTKDLQQEANKKKISIRPYNVIYKLIDDVKKEINKRLPLVDAEEVIGMSEG